MRRGEEGTALLTVLLLVAVLSVLAADTLDRLSLTTRLTGTAAAIDQSRAFGQAAERLAAIRIGQLVAADPARTTNAAGWQGTPLPLPLPVGQATLTVVDGGNCFNLNSLATGGMGADPSAEPMLTANESAIAQFAGLMAVLGVAPGDARRVAEGAADWIDSDSRPEPAGAEDAAYRAIAPGYMPANRPMASATELRTVAGVTPRPVVAAASLGVRAARWRPGHQPEHADAGAGAPARHAGARPAGRRAGARPAGEPPGGRLPVDRGLLEATTVQRPESPDGAQVRLRSRWFDARVDVTLDGTRRTTRALMDAGGPAGDGPTRIVRSAAE